MCPGVLKPVHTVVCADSEEQRLFLSYVYIFGETEDIVSRGHF